jgi:hypothetical protein
MRLIFGPTMFKTPKNYTFHGVKVNKGSLPFKSVLPSLVQNEHSRDAPFLGQKGYFTYKCYFVYPSCERNSLVLLFSNKFITTSSKNIQYRIWWRMSFPNTDTANTLKLEVHEIFIKADTVSVYCH